LKAALVKQAYDVFGPWSGVLWKDISPKKLFDVWPGKAVYWELTCLLQADWYIVPQATDNDYIRDLRKWRPDLAEIIRKYTRNITAPEHIPFDDYDLAIVFDACLAPPASSRTLFAYYAQEHWDALYTQSLQKPARGYDLFLAHMMDAEGAINSLPKAISFPYLHDLELTRSAFPVQKQDAVWVDWRTLMTLAMREVSESWTKDADAAAARLQELVGLPVRHRGRYFIQAYGVYDPPAWGDAALYLQALAGCKYYISVGRVAGAGQGLSEAASAGCLCIGQGENVYHRLICHPACLCDDIAEMPSRLNAIAHSKNLQAEILSWQDQALGKHFQRGPLEFLQKAIQIKAGNPEAVRRELQFLGGT
jgi:hypothetical protein